MRAQELALNLQQTLTQLLLQKQLQPSCCHHLLKLERCRALRLLCAFAMQRLLMRQLQSICCQRQNDRLLPSHQMTKPLVPFALRQLQLQQALRVCP